MGVFTTNVYRKDFFLLRVIYSKFNLKNTTWLCFLPYIGKYCNEIKYFKVSSIDFFYDLKDGDISMLRIFKENPMGKKAL